ncbi:FER-like protein [Mya arenaria]|uniref:FER-like protein n=1 Tax=Mya arenaria TaxID=6604 RepID=A0ABY7DBB0_MYAAR|nr:FER-like protein [Mya arenaria]
MMRGMCFGLVVFAALAVTFVTSQSWSGCPAYSYYRRAVYGYIYWCKAEEFRPEIVQSNVTLAHIRRSDNETQYMFTVVGKDENDFTLVWSNQKRFNNLRFEFDTLIDISEIPERPNYVHDAKIGIVASSIEASVSKIPRDGGVNRYIASNKTYNCETGISEDNPAVEKDTCEINDENFATLIEHGDILLLKFRSRSGGFQKLINIDDQGKPYTTKHYNGLQGEEKLEFRFDFVVPEHCSLDSGSCPSKPLHIDDEFTNSNIQARWSGWTDAMSGMWQYYIEVFKLAPNRDERLVEVTPIDPVYKETLNHTKGEMISSYRPEEPGMYSVLLKVSDMANNSRIARRFVLYDDTSVISLSNETDKKLYISSAVEETGYAWQTSSNSEDNSVTVNVRWDGHFANKLHEDGKFLAEIEKYPIQFKDIEDDGILMSLKFVADTLDDDEGERTREAITNYHGIIKFEVAYVQSPSEEVPTTGWTVIPLQESISTQRILEDGDRLRVWVRATDVMGNTNTDSTFMRIDGSPPFISSGNGSEHQVVLNIEGEEFKHASRASFLASDLQSGVHKIEIKLTVKSPGKEDMVTYRNFTEARRGNDITDPRCIGFDKIGMCLLPSQIVEIDNCWLTVSKEDLETASGELELTAYNQAMLTATTKFDMGPLTKLQDSGPTNMRIENKSPTGFRLAWDLPESESCYGAADIVIILTHKGPTGEIQIKSFETPSTATYFDFLGLNPEVEYNLGLQIKAEGGTAQAFGQDLSVVTSKEESPGGVSTGAVVGIILGILVLCVLVIVVLFFLTRRGIIDVQPQRKMGEIRRAVTKRVRQSRMFAPETQGQSHENKAYAYDNRQSELYLYGGMDFNSSSKGYISRDQITFDVLLKSGHFANIYRARYNGQNVVAKTLKENFTKDDELLMKAKINFSSDRVGDHPNVIKFIGAVVDDTTMGPMIINEFCENGTLRDYLEKNKSNMTVEMQENLFRFGLDIVKGMEFLATRGVTHRRLAARNILLNYLNEVKIAGFGPQTAGEEDGGDSESGKKERIPIKWMAPECMTSTKKANERSDVWSYAVVLWEIFSLGETPYTGKSRDLPQRLKRGERLGKPELCDDTWYKVMKHCWEFDPKKRPRFAEVREQLDTLFVNAPGDDFYYYKR